MGSSAAAHSAQGGEDGMAGEESTADVERESLGSGYRGALARSAGPLRLLQDRASVLLAVAASGLFTAIIDALRIKLDDRNLIDWNLWCMGGAQVRAARAASGADKKVSQRTPTNRRITRWAAFEAGSDRSSTW